MKVEHREAIERAKLHGVPPMVLAHQLLVKDLVEAALFELRNNKAPFGRLNEEGQQEVIDRITEQAEEAVTTAIGIISSRSVCTIPFKVADSKFKEKSITVTGVVDVQDPNRASLVDLSGKLALLVLAPNDYNEGLDGIRAERDQRELPLSAAELAAGMAFDGQQDRQYEGMDGRHKCDGNHGGPRCADPECWFDTEPQQAASSEQFGKEFGDYDYAEASQLIVLKAAANRFEAAWVQSRLAISSDQAATLLLRLLDDGVIETVDEGATALEHGYKVVAKLEDVV